MLNIRPATPEDVPLILQLIRELAEYERAPQAAVATADDLLRDGWGAEPKFRCVIAEWREARATTGTASGPAEWQPAGFALFFYNYSTWQGRAGLYLEDLFVRPVFRGKGIGKACSFIWRRWRCASSAAASSGRCWTGTRPPSSSTSPSALRSCRNG